MSATLSLVIAVSGEPALPYLSETFKKRLGGGFRCVYRRVRSQSSARPPWRRSHSYSSSSTQTD